VPARIPTSIITLFLRGRPQGPAPTNQIQPQAVGTTSIKILLFRADLTKVTIPTILAKIV
jgi:hypothetical protein